MAVDVECKYLGRWRDKIVVCLERLPYCLISFRADGRRSRNIKGGEVLTALDLEDHFRL
jgi:hypothetical protein